MKGYEIGDSIHGHRIIAEARKVSDPVVNGQECQHNHQSAASTLTLPMKRLSSTGAET
jgi:hypothetical protein